MCKTIPRELLRKLLRQRRSKGYDVVVGIDQSLSNTACTLFVNGIPTDRVVFHTGSTETKAYKAKIKRGDTIFGYFVDSHIAQVEYITSQVIAKMAEWNPNEICLEGLAFGASGKVERQLAGLYHSIMTSLHRELEYCMYKQLITITPTQAKKLARDMLPEDERYLSGQWTTHGKPKLNPMKKPDMIKALKCTGNGWLLEGYTRSTLVASRKTETGIEDIPDSYFIGRFFIENRKLFIK